MDGPLANWAGNHVYRAARVHEPGSVEEVCDLVARSPRIRALGTRHSFNDVADLVGGDLVSLRRLDRIAPLETGPDGRPRVTIGAGVTYGHLCRHLAPAGYAVHNLASLPHISVAGACATATHGSGDANPILASAVSSIDVVIADGSVRTFARAADADAFRGAVVGLGGAGVVVRLTLDLVPTFDVAQSVYQGLPFAAAAEHFDAIMAGAYSVSLFTDWRTDRVNQVWVKRRVGDRVPPGSDPAGLGAAPATRDLHPILEISPINCTPQMGVPGPWHERLPHFRMDFTPSSGEELQSEYLVPRENAVAGLRAIDAMRDRVAPHLQISEVRTIAADDFWMSPCYRRPCAGIHFTWKKDWPAVRALLPEIETRLAPLGARPHWGKLFTLPGEQLRPRYEQLPAFRDLLRTCDPTGKFRNAFLDRYVLGAAG